MKLTLTALLVSLLSVAPAGDSDPTLAYEVAHVKRKLIHYTADGKVRLEAGAVLYSGDRLRTGSWSSAEIVAPELRARFRIGASTRFRLASDTPGVLLELERGRLRAVFDALLTPDPPERLIQTPSALLAVRGTEYGVEVDRAGVTTLVVFRGTVETVDLERLREPVQVTAGQKIRIERGTTAGTPTDHGMSPQQWDNGRRPDFPDDRSRSWSEGPGGAAPGMPGGRSQQQPPRHGGGGGGSGHGQRPTPPCLWWTVQLPSSGARDEHRHEPVGDVSRRGGPSRRGSAGVGHRGGG